MNPLAVPADHVVAVGPGSDGRCHLEDVVLRVPVEFTPRRGEVGEIVSHEARLHLERSFEVVAHLLLVVLGKVVVGQVVVSDDEVGVLLAQGRSLEVERAACDVDGHVDAVVQIVEHGQVAENLGIVRTPDVALFLVVAHGGTAQFERTAVVAQTVVVEGEVVVGTSQDGGVQMVLTDEVDGLLAERERFVVLSGVETVGREVVHGACHVERVGVLGEYVERTLLGLDGMAEVTVGGIHPALLRERLAVGHVVVGGCGRIERLCRLDGQGVGFLKVAFEAVEGCEIADAVDILLRVFVLEVLIDGAGFGEGLDALVEAFGLLAERADDIIKGIIPLNIAADSPENCLLTVGIGADAVGKGCDARSVIENDVIVGFKPVISTIRCDVCMKLGKLSVFVSGDILTQAKGIVAPAEIQIMALPFAGRVLTYSG